LPAPSVERYSELSAELVSSPQPEATWAHPHGVGGVKALHVTLQHSDAIRRISGRCSIRRELRRGSGLRRPAPWRVPGAAAPGAHCPITCQFPRWRFRNRHGPSPAECDAVSGDHISRRALSIRRPGRWGTPTPTPSGSTPGPRPGAGFEQNHFFPGPGQAFGGGESSQPAPITITSMAGRIIGLGYLHACRQRLPHPLLLLRDHQPRPGGDYGRGASRPGHQVRLETAA
jgi:hypothetical protein